MNTQAHEARSAADAPGTQEHVGGPPARMVLWVGLALVLALAASVLLFGLPLWRSAARAAGERLPIYGSVADFALTNQAGATVSLGDLRGHVWVADLIFTRCPGPCLKMTRQMKELQQALAGSSAARLVSLTTDPEFDRPAVLSAYAQRFGADPHRWNFLTGTKKQIFDLAVGSLKLTAIEKDPADRQTPDDLFIHSTILVLVDQQARLRGIFETMGDDVVPERVRERIVRAVGQLEHES